MLLEFLIPKSKFDFFSFFFKKADVTTLKKNQPKLKFQPKSLPEIINSNKTDAKNAWNKYSHRALLYLTFQC